MDRRWRTRLAFALVAISTILLLAHFLVFRDAKNLAFYTTMDIAFLPLQVLLVTLVIEALLERQAKAELVGKLNMVIGVFFTEVGSELLRRLARFDAEVGVRDEFLVTTQWDDSRFARARRAIAAYDFDVDARLGDLTELRDFLRDSRDLLVRLLENPNLLEHESFTDALWAVFHLVAELEERADLTGLPDSDLAHLAGDIKRAYAAVAIEWISYMRHLKKAYPYLFSLAVRTNPLDPDACVTC